MTKGIPRVDEGSPDMINDRFTIFVALHQALDILTDDDHRAILSNVTHHPLKGLSSLSSHLVNAICKAAPSIVLRTHGLADKARNYNVNGWHQLGPSIVCLASAEVLHIIKQVLKVSKVITDPFTFLWCMFTGEHVFYFKFAVECLGQFLQHWHWGVGAGAQCAEFQRKVVPNTRSFN